VIDVDAGCGCDNDINLLRYLCSTYSNATTGVVVTTDAGTQFTGTVNAFFDDIVAVLDGDGNTSVIDLDSVIAVTSSLPLPQPCILSCGCNGGFTF